MARKKIIKKTASLKSKSATKKPKAALKKSTAKPKTKKTTKTAAKKSRKVAPIPKGYTAVTPYLIVKNAADALTFYKKAFGAKENMRFADPTGTVMHAEIKIGGSLVMLADEFPEMGARGPASIGGTPVFMHLYVKDVDAVVKQAIAAGAEIQRPVQDQFWGDRSGCVMDPFGHLWNISTCIENVSPKEVHKRFKALGDQCTD